MPKYKSVEELNLKHQEVLKIVDTWPEEKKRSYLPIINEKYKQSLKELTQNQSVETLKNLRTEVGIKKLKPPESLLGQKQLMDDQKKFDEYTEKYKSQNEVVTGQSKDNTIGAYDYVYEPDIRESAIGKRNEMADSLRLWYEWDNLRKKGVNVSLSDFRDYKNTILKDQESQSMSLINNYANALLNKGYSQSTAELFKRMAFSQIKSGKSANDALRIAAGMVTTTSPRNTPLGK